METFDNMYEIDHNFIMGYSDNFHNTPIDTAFLFKTFRVIYIKKGVVDWKIGNEIYTLKTGDIALFNNIVPRRILKIYPNEPLNYDLFAFLPDLLTDPSIPLLYYGNHPKVISEKNGNTDKIHLMLNELKTEIASENKYKYELIKSLLYVTLINIARLANLSDKETQNRINSQRVIAQATQYIQNNLSSNLNVSTLAKMFGYSNEHFSRTFKKYTETSVTSYISNARIEKTLYLITTENCNVLTAAIQSGFNTSSGFYKAFKKHKGSSPLKFYK